MISRCCGSSSARLSDDSISVLVVVSSSVLVAMNTSKGPRGRAGWAGPAGDQLTLTSRLRRGGRAGGRAADAERPCCP